MYNINVKRIARKLFRLNTEVLVEFGDGSAISIRKILHQLAFLQQKDARGDVGNEVEVMAGDDDRGALLLTDALKDVLSDYQGYKGCHLLLVFDAYKVKGNAGKRETFHNIEVVYTKQDETADAFIEKTVFGIRDRYKVTVATSDGLEQQTVMSLGALRMSARELKEHIEMTKRAGMEAFISG